MISRVSKDIPKKHHSIPTCLIGVCDANLEIVEPKVVRVIVSMMLFYFLTTFYHSGVDAFKSDCVASGGWLERYRSKLFKLLLLRSRRLSISSTMSSSV